MRPLNFVPTLMDWKFYYECELLLCTQAKTLLWYQTVQPKYYQDNIPQNNHSFWVEYQKHFDSYAYRNVVQWIYVSRLWFCHAVLIPLGVSVLLLLLLLAFWGALILLLVLLLRALILLSVSVPLGSRCFDSSALCSSGCCWVSRRVDSSVCSGFCNNEHATLIIYG